MRKILSSLAGLVVASLLLGACDAHLSATAARVDGTTISAQRLDRTLAAINGDAAYRCVLSSAAGGQIQAGVGAGTYASSFAASILTTLIEERALASEVAALGLSTGPFARQVSTQSLVAQFAPAQGSPCTESGAAVYQGLPRSYRSFLVSLQADQGILLAHAAGVPLNVAGVGRYAAGHPGTTSLECISAIEVASKALASSLTGRIRAGASFSTLAKQYSVDQSSAPRGGALGCVLPSQLASPLGGVVAALTPGSLSPPVAFGSAWVVFQLTSRVPASAAQVANVILRSEASKDTGLVVGALHRAEVTVDPSFGSWGKASGIWQVLPESGPPARLLENPAAVVPAASSSPRSLG